MSSWRGEEVLAFGVGDGRLEDLRPPAQTPLRECAAGGHKVAGSGKVAFGVFAGPAGPGTVLDLRPVGELVLAHEEGDKEAALTQGQLAEDPARALALAVGVQWADQHDRDINVGVLGRLAAGVGAEEVDPLRRSP